MSWLTCPEKDARLASGNPCQSVAALVQSVAAMAVTSIFSKKGGRGKGNERE